MKEREQIPYVINKFVHNYKVPFIVLEKNFEYYIYHMLYCKRQNCKSIQYE